MHFECQILPELYAFSYIQNSSKRIEQSIPITLNGFGGTLRLLIETLVEEARGLMTIAAAQNTHQAWSIKNLCLIGEFLTDLNFENCYEKYKKLTEGDRIYGDSRVSYFLNYIATHAARIKDIHSLKSALECIPVAWRFEFLECFDSVIDLTGENGVSLIDSLPPAVYEDFVKKYELAPQSAEALLARLASLKEPLRLTVALTHDQQIENFENLVTTLKYLQPRERIHLVERCTRLIQNEMQLQKILKILPFQDHITCLERFSDKITSLSALTWRWWQYLEENREAILRLIALEKRRKEIFLEEFKSQPEEQRVQYLLGKDPDFLQDMNYERFIQENMSIPSRFELLEGWLRISSTLEDRTPPSLKTIINDSFLSLPLEQRPLFLLKHPIPFFLFGTIDIAQEELLKAFTPEQLKEFMPQLQIHFNHHFGIAQKENWFSYKAQEFFLALLNVLEIPDFTSLLYLAPDMKDYPTLKKLFKCLRCNPDSHNKFPKRDGKACAVMVGIILKYSDFELFLYLMKSCREQTQYILKGLLEHHVKKLGDAINPVFRLKCHLFFMENTEDLPSFYQKHEIQRALNQGMFSHTEFLLQAAMIEDEAFFEELLHHPESDLWAINVEGKSLTWLIQNSRLDEAKKAERLKKVETTCRSRVNAVSQNNWLLDFHGFSLEELPSVLEAPVNPSGANADETSHYAKFQELIDWLLPILKTYGLPCTQAFERLQSNLKAVIEDRATANYATAFKLVLDQVVSALDEFCAVLNALLKDLKSDTSPSEETIGDKLNQEFSKIDLSNLAACPEGVSKTFEDASFILRRANSAQIAVYQQKKTATELARILGTPEEERFHLPLVSIEAAAGLPTKPKSSDIYGYYYIKSSWLRATARHILSPSKLMSRLMPELPRVWWGQDAPSEIELTDSSQVVRLNALEEALRPLWQYPPLLPFKTLHSNGELDFQASIFKWFGADADEVETFKVDLRFTIKHKKQEYQKDLDIAVKHYLIDQGYFKNEPEVFLQTRAHLNILLTQDPETFTEAHQHTHLELLTLPDALGFLLWHVESHPEILRSLNLNALLWINPNYPSNIFRTLASNVFYAEKLGGWEIHWATLERQEGFGVIQQQLEFREKPSILQNFYQKIHDGQSSGRIEREMEYLLYTPGALLFCLAEFQKSSHTQETFKELIRYVGAELAQYDSVIGVFQKMLLSPQEDLQQVAKLFLQTRLENQIEMKLWDLCWKTLECLRSEDWMEHVSAHPEMLKILTPDSEAWQTCFVLSKRKGGVEKLLQLAKSLPMHTECLQELERSLSSSQIFVKAQSVFPAVSEGREASSGLRSTI